MGVLSILMTFTNSLDLLPCKERGQRSRTLTDFSKLVLRFDAREVCWRSRKERKGIAKVSDALIDLYYLLLVNGVEHENKTGRGSLPRMLQLWKDAEEPGFDKLLLENVRDRITQAGKSRFDDELKVDHFEAIDSETLALIQLADLLTSSISRVLNAKGERSNSKDEFANYLLEVVRMPGGPSEERVSGDMTYHLSL